MKGTRLSTDLVSGAVFVAFGAGLLILGWDYPLGTMSRVGPGLFPKIVGGALILIGLVELGRGLVRAGGSFERWEVVPLLLVSGSFFVFALLVERAGLIATCILVMVLAALAGPDALKPRQLLVIAIAPVLAGLLFVQTLKVPLSLWPRIW